MYHKSKGQTIADLAVGVLAFSVLIVCIVVVFHILFSSNREGVITQIQDRWIGFVQDEELNIVCLSNGATLDAGVVTCFTLNTDEEVNIFRARYVSPESPVIIITPTPNE